MSDREVPKKLYADLEGQIAKLEEQRRQLQNAESEKQRRETYIEVLKTGTAVTALGTALLGLTTAMAPASNAASEPPAIIQIDTGEAVSVPSGDVEIIIRTKTEPVAGASGEQERVGAEQQQLGDIEQN